jgi:peptidylprolyl isomerase
VIAGTVVAALLASLVVGVFAFTRDNSTNVASKSTSTTEADTATSEPAAGSAAGKPCVPLADPLPEGAPTVPVKVGPPPTTLVSEDLKPGTGAAVTAKDTVTVNYIGVSCSTGKIFDSSYSRKEPATFPLTGVIKGWQEGIPGIKVGGQRLLGIPADQAYGASGQPPIIAPDEALWFVVEVLDAKPS